MANPTTNTSHFSSMDGIEQQESMADFTPRPYQLEMFEQAKKQNSILVLSSGSGKTFISILLIKEYADQIRGPLSHGSKRSVFIVTSVPLVYQQAEAIRRHTALSVGTYEGAMGLDQWNDAKWQEELEKNEVLVMVAQIFLDLVLHARLPISSVNLLIMDECHYTTGQHPMRQIMREYETLKKSHPHLCPRILGLTACVVHSKCKNKNVMVRMKELEEAMNCALVTSSDCTKASAYNSSRVQKIVTFNTNKLSEYQDMIQTKLQGVLQNAIEKFGDKNSKKYKYVRKRLNNIRCVMEELGEWCVLDAIKYEIMDMEAEEDINYPLETKEVLKFLCTQLKEMYDSVCAGQDFSADNPVPHVSEKVSKLLDIIRSCDTDVQGLIFVERRNIAKILCNALLAVAEKNNDFSFVRPLYVLSYSALHNVDHKLADLEMHQQKEALTKFSVCECNFLISTSLLEEGIDTQNCNVVIRFDKPLNYRSFIQSRGRARAVPSKFFLMVESGEEQAFRKTLDGYKETELCLSELCKDRKLPNDSDTSLHFADEEEIPPYEPYGTGGPKVTMNSAIPLINIYCNQLPRDRFTELTPEVVYDTKVECKRESNRLPEHKSKRKCVGKGSGLPEDHSKEESVRAGIRLPINACLKEVVYGDWMDTKDLAKKSAAMAMCRRLHEMGELDYHLKPSEQKDESFLGGLVEIPEEEPVKPGDPEPGTKRRRQVYLKETCQAFTQGQRGHYQLFSVNLEPAISQSDEEPLPYETTVGLMCRKNLIHCPFPLYSPRLGEVEVHIKALRYINHIAPDLMRQIEHFHKLVFEHLLQINTSVFEFTSKHTGAFIVPITSTGTVDTTILKKLKSLTSLRPPVDSTAFHFKRSDYEDAIIYPVYAPTDPMFYVTQILDDVNPRSKFPDTSKGYENYEEYYYLKYNMRITHKRQPLLVAKHMIKELNYLKKPICIPNKKEGKKLGRDPPKFVPELCGIMPLKASLWWQLMCIPSILHRLNTFCLAQQLSSTMNPTYCWTDTQSDAITLSWNETIADKSYDSIKSAHICDDNLKDNISISLMKSDSKYISPIILVHALTLHQANDDFDLERMEILGDSFLKFITAEYLSLKFPKDHEGRLSLRRVKLVCNLTLYALAKLRSIPDKIQSTKLLPYENGLRPGFVVKRRVAKQLKRMGVPHDVWPKLSDFGDIANLNEAVDEVMHPEGEKVQKSTCFNPWTQQEVSDKCIADVVEALIGAYLLTCGSQAAIDFLHNLGVGVYNGESLLRTKVKVESALVSEGPEALNEVEKIYQKMCLDRLEEKIHYTFKDKSFIVQAITHSSCCQNKATNCYQRVEFLGDAVLDYLVTGLVFCHHTQYSPGQMSDLRSHYVKNETLALVCISNGLQQHLLHMAPKLQMAVDKFLITLDSTVDEDMNTEEDEVDLKAVEVPKVLGDLVESIIGAVYLDSGRSLQEAWNVVEVLMGNIIKKSLLDIPVNCIRKLYEEAPGQVKYKKLPRGTEDVAKYEVQVQGLPTLIGTGKNYRTAKMSAAKAALRTLHQAQKGHPNI